MLPEDAIFVLVIIGFILAALLILLTMLYLHARQQIRLLKEEEENQKKGVAQLRRFLYGMQVPDLPEGYYRTRGTLLVIRYPKPDAVVTGLPEEYRKAVTEAGNVDPDKTTWVIYAQWTGYMLVVYSRDPLPDGFRIQNRRLIPD